jgi:single-strand DNA-binding protein
VLQGFNGTLTMLDGRSGGAGAGMSDNGQADYGGSDNGYSGGGGKSSPSKGGFDKQLDDEIPF